LIFSQKRKGLRPPPGVLNKQLFSFAFLEKTSMENKGNGDRVLLGEKYYWMWRDIVARSRFRQWKEIEDELAAECEYAIQNDMETEFWCVNCKHSECTVHKRKRCSCVGKTQRGRNCHFEVTAFHCGKFLCKYHAKWD